ncbi:MAG: CpcT/CpeT family chromophore lyase [Planctomycetota bacterium]|nr:CpcT/CpeT family chromophore lyase [Planctomycetota bacterium]
MSHLIRRTYALAFASLAIAAAPLAAQDGHEGHDHGAQPAIPARTQTAPETLQMSWSDPTFAEIAELLTGSWKTTQPVAMLNGEAGATSDVIMSVAPARLSTLPDAFYVETARADSPDQPYRAAFLQLYRRQGEIRMRTLEVRDPNNPMNNLLIGMWAVPQYMPDIPRDAMIATLDLEFTQTPDGWVGESPYPYPTALGGAFEMTSRMKLTNGRIETADRGYNADGNVVWGASEGDTYVFEPIASPFAVETDDMGVVTIMLRDEDTPELADGDTVAFQYTGWLTNGLMFDTSRRQSGRMFQYTLPAAAIEGWNIATYGMTEGDWKKFIVPSDLGYGPSSAAGGRIPPNSTLIFEAELVGVTKATPQGE